MHLQRRNILAFEVSLGIYCFKSRLGAHKLWFSVPKGASEREYETPVSDTRMEQFPCCSFPLRENHTYVSMRRSSYTNQGCLCMRGRWGKKNQVRVVTLRTGPVCSLFGSVAHIPIFLEPHTTGHFSARLPSPPHKLHTHVAAQDLHEEKKP